MRGRFATGIDKGRLAAILALFFVALSVPTAVLVYHAYGQLRGEAFYQQRLLAEELAQRVDARLRSLMAVEESRSIADYGFLILEGDPRSNFLQRSPLSSFPIEPTIPGLVSYFQIDASGAFSTPLLPVGAAPVAFGVSTADAGQRLALEQRVRALLKRADTTNAATAPPSSAALPEPQNAAEEKRRGDKDTAAQAVFDRLNDASKAGAKKERQRPAANALGRVEDLKLDARQAQRSQDLRQAEEDRDKERPSASAFSKSTEPSIARGKRKELTAVPELERRVVGGGAQFGGAVATLESELDPFVLRRLDGQHFVLFRKVWLNGARLIQGAVIAQDGLLEGVIAAPFRDTALSRVAGLLVAYNGDVLGAIDAAGSRTYFAAAREGGDLLYRSSLSAPLDDLELIFTIEQLPLGPGGAIIGWAALILGVVLCAGCVVIYRFGAAQLELTRAQQNFVSAVSHELKTPLTSIRMYSEILRAGWASEDKKRTYYDFIYHESERLSRLIANVLQLARLTRKSERPEPKRMTAGHLLDLVESKIAAHIEQAGFRLTLDRAAADAVVIVDDDSFVQIMINLVDNALKFSAKAERKEIEIGCRAPFGRVAFLVRDYGPGIATQHLKHIFKLFYRAEGELTRETVGTGIGLALVQELTSAMGGSVDVRNCHPGAEVTVTFPAAAELAA